ncbi:MAG: hypothetical protein IIU00_08755 [Clostridia bacterium]|nr:hypothetical protein [Clostridia bacterium]
MDSDYKNNALLINGDINNAFILAFSFWAVGEMDFRGILDGVRLTPL